MNEHAEIRDLPDCKRLTYAEYGDPEGRPLLFCHGWPASRLQGRGLHELALKRGIRLVAPDRPGVGGSSFQPQRSLLDWPPLMQAFADRLGWDRFEVMGVSGGGPYALSLGAHLPERIERVSLVCPAPPLAWQKEKGGLHPAYRALILVRRKMPWALGAPLGLARWVSLWPSGHPLLKLLHQSLPASDRHLLATPRHRDFVSDDYGEAMRSPNHALIRDGDIYLEPWGFEPSEVTVPTELWHGTADHNLPLEMVERMAREIPSCTAHWIPNEGHYSILFNEAPRILAPLNQGAETSPECADRRERGTASAALR